MDWKTTDLTRMVLPVTFLLIIKEKLNKKIKKMKIKKIDQIKMLVSTVAIAISIGLLSSCDREVCEECDVVVIDGEAQYVCVDVWCD